ncbi:MAG: hypothetical protein IJ728_12460 [Selenomonadaceae bacterium]|nr:hypothetical protein [Selenomonadaceae bacterium]
MIKKYFLSILTAIILMSTTIAVEAAENNFSKSQSIAVVIVGNADFKTKDFFKSVEQFFKSPTEKPIIVGSKIQSKYQTYWLEKGLLSEGEPTQVDFIEFVNYSGYGKIIYLKIDDAVLDTHERKKGKARSRSSITVNAFLVDSQGIKKVVSETQEEDSKTSELRAKRGAFKKCVEEIAKVFNPLL